jgi:hypothetical protein
MRALLDDTPTLQARERRDAIMFRTALSHETLSGLLAVCSYPYARIKGGR